MNVSSWQPYSRADPPVSAGKIILSEFLEHFLDSWVIADCELPADFEDPGESGGILRSGIRFLGNLIQEGEIKSYVRPFGGGDIARFPAEKWEVDDFVPRFRNSACDPQAWSDPAAEPTHWLFVSDEDAERFLARWEIGLDEQNNGAIPASKEEDLLRLPAVLQRTGLSRSTLYEMVRKGQFPKPLKISERSSGWRSSEVQQWVDERGAGKN